jgi:hypothetical protein
VYFLLFASNSISRCGGCSAEDGLSLELHNNSLESKEGGSSQMHMLMTEKYCAKFSIGFSDK